MESIRVRNLRSLADTGDVELKPITLLVGANSSGKSSFLRVFPMLRQSAETRTGSGLLLNEPYVDYGQFPVALRQDADPAEMILDFKVMLAPRSFGPTTRFSFLLDRLPVRFGVHFARRSQAELYSFVRQVDLAIGDDDWKEEIVLQASEGGNITSLKIGDHVAQSEASRLRLKAGRGIVPQLIPASMDDDEGQLFVEDNSVRSGLYRSASSGD